MMKGEQVTRTAVQSEIVLPVGERGEVDYSGVVNGQALATQEQIDAADEVIRELGFDPDTVGATVQFRRPRDENGQIMSDQPMTSATVDALWIKKPMPRKTSGEEFSYVQPAPAVVRPTKTRVRTMNRRSDKTALVIPDIQIGRRLDTSGQWHNFHDVEAIEVARMLARYIKPDYIIFNGDNNDFPSLGKHGADPTVCGTVNWTLQQNHDAYAGFAADSPESIQRVLSGNHDNRLPRYIREGAPELIGIRQAGANGRLGGLALTMDWLTNLQALRDQGVDIQWLEGYPNNDYWLNDRLRIIHGDMVNSKGSTAAKLLNNNPMSSVIFGHVHRIESHYKTTMGSGGRPVQHSAHSFGTLARVDGAVPSYHSALGADESPMRYFENWQQGVGLVEFKKGDAPFNVTPIPIHTHDGHVAFFDGKEFRPTVA